MAGGRLPEGGRGWHSFDLKENKLFATIPLPARAKFATCFARRPTIRTYTPSVIRTATGVAGAGNVPVPPNGMNRFLVRVDLKQKTAVRLGDSLGGNNPWMQQSFLPVAMSRDGQRLLTCWYNGGTTMCAGLFNVDEAAGTFQQVVSNINGAPVMMNAPNMNSMHGYGAIVASSRWWTVAIASSRRNWARRCGPSPARRWRSTRGAGPGRFASGVATGVADLLGSGDAQGDRDADAPAAEAAQPAGVGPAVGPGMAPAYRAAPGGAGGVPAAAAAETVQCDLAGQRVFCGFATKGYVVGLDKLDVKIPKRLEIVVPGQVTAAAGRTVRLPLATNAAPGNPAATFTLDSPPPFAKIDHSDLVLAATMASFGSHEVVVKASQGDLSDEVTLSVRVEVPSVHLGFVIRGVALDRRQDRAVAWGSAAVPANGIGGMPPADPRMEFAVIDLPSQKVVSTHSMPGGVQFIALNEKYVYVIPPNPHVLYRLDRAEPSRSRRVLLGGTPQSLAATPDNRVAVEINDGGGLLLRTFDRRTLQTGDRDDSGLAPSGRQPRPVGFAF